MRTVTLRRGSEGRVRLGHLWVFSNEIQSFDRSIPPGEDVAVLDSLGALLDGGTPVDAVFAMNDALALGALYALHARGVDVPADVALVGFDDVDDVRYATPTLSSVAPGRDEIAHTAVALLRSRLAGDGGPYVRVISEARVVARQSTGAAGEQVISVQPGSQVPADAPV